MPRPVALVFAIAALAAACSGGAAPGSLAPTAVPADPAVYAALGAHGVGVTTLQLVDPARPTPPNGAFAGAPNRSITLEVWYPAAPGGASETVGAPIVGGPYPLVVFAHGYSSFRRQSSLYAQHLASHGYIVASPDFPSTGLTSPGGPRLAGVLDQPGDVAFIVDAFEEYNESAGDRFERAYNGEVGITGHSLGGLTSLLAVFGPLRDERIKVAVPFAAPGCFFDGSMIGDTSVAVLHVVASEDLIVDPAGSRRAYDLSPPPRYLAELRGADHTGFLDFDLDDEGIVGDLRTGLLSRERNEDDAAEIARRLGGRVENCDQGGGVEGDEEMPNTRQRELMRFLGALFFEAYLRDDAGALALLRSGSLMAFAPDLVMEFE